MLSIVYAGQRMFCGSALLSSRTHRLIRPQPARPRGTSEAAVGAGAGAAAGLRSAPVLRLTCRHTPGSAARFLSQRKRATTRSRWDKHSSPSSRNHAPGPATLLALPPGVSRSRTLGSGPRRCTTGPSGPRMLRPLGVESPTVPRKPARDYAANPTLVTYSYWAQFEPRSMMTSCQAASRPSESPAAHARMKASQRRTLIVRYSTTRVKR